MGGRGEGETDAIAFIHAADAASWGLFLQSKLHSDSYKIQSYLHHEPNQNYIPGLFSGTQTCAVLVSPMLLEPQHSVFWSRCTERFHHQTVLLLLGVDLEELKLNLGTSVCERVLSHHWLTVDGSKDAVNHALVKLIEVFEQSDSSALKVLREDSVLDEDGVEQGESEDVYDYPPQPRQQNGVVRVMPEVLYESDSRDVLVLMEREAEGALTMVTESGCGPSCHVVMKRVSSSAYLATLPSGLEGKVGFMILSQDEHNLGTASFHVRSTMDQLRYIIQKETSPLTMLCRALGISGTASSETEELDVMLAKRLAFSQFPNGLTSVLYPDDHTTGDQGSSQWPSLLHFAAEFNLTRVCEELLRYPGIIHSACTENSDGFFPCQLAGKNGFRALEKRLVQYVDDMRLRRSAADSGISFSENIPAPPRHSSQSHLYVNERPQSVDPQEELSDGAGDYVDMSAVKIYGYAKPRSYSEGCVKSPYAKTPSEARIAEEDGKENEPPPLKPKTGRSQSTASAFAIPTHLLGAHGRPDSSSSESSDNQEAWPKESGSKSSTETLTHSEAGTTGGWEQRGGTLGEGQGERVSWSLGPAGNRPASQVSTASSQSDYEVPRASYAEAASDDPPVLRCKNTKRSKLVQDKISHFFKKIRPARRQHSSSESDLPTKGSKKSVVYTRQSTSSDPSGYTSSSHNADSERDSGAVCDDHGTMQVALRSKRRDSSSRNMGKRNGISMQRRVSVRVQRAKDEDLSETPTLPARKSSCEAKETFVSFIK